MKWKLVILLLALSVAGCKSFQPTPKPQSGGSYMATIPPVQMPGPVQLVETRPVPVPVRIEMKAPDNPAAASSSVWTREDLGLNSRESLRVDFAPVQVDHARAAWGGIEKFKAQLATYRPIRMAGIALIVLACAGFVPQVRLIMGRSGQTAAFISGFALVFGAQMFQGNETLAMVLTAIGLGMWVVARRYGILQGAVLKAEGKI